MLQHSALLVHASLRVKHGGGGDGGVDGASQSTMLVCPASMMFFPPPLSPKVIATRNLTLFTSYHVVVNAR